MPSPLYHDPLISWVPLGKSLPPSRPQFPHLKHGLVQLISRPCIWIHKFKSLSNTLSITLINNTNSSTTNCQVTLVTLSIHADLQMGVMLLPAS